MIEETDTFNVLFEITKLKKVLCICILLSIDSRGLNKNAQHPLYFFMFVKKLESQIIHYFFL